MGRCQRCAPSVDRTVEGLPVACGERIANGGAMAANVIGLTTQVPVDYISLTAGLVGG